MDTAAGRITIMGWNTSLPTLIPHALGQRDLQWRYELAISQAGSGYSWRTHAGLNRINRWEQNLIRDWWGKFLYVRDRNTGEFWSPTYQPLGSGLQDYRVRHGIGYTVIESRRGDLRHDILQHYFTQGAVENVLEPILEMEQFTAGD
jgi:cellobiose phosphorylase